MTTPIKLRAWHKREKRMYDNIGIIPQEFEVRLGLHHSCDFDEVEIMQYSGITDKQDNEIAAGDIVADGIHGNGTVVLENGAFCVEFPQMVEVTGQGLPYMQLLIHTQIQAILGNVYENKDLLSV